MLRHIEGPMNEDWARKLHLGERFLCQLVVLPLALAVPDITMADVKLHQATALQEVRFARSSSKNLPGTGWTEYPFRVIHLMRAVGVPRVSRGLGVGF